MMKAWIYCVVALALANCTMTSPAVTLSAADAPEIARIQEYLEALPRLQAHFVQSGDFGPGAGTLWLDRPGHLRIDYAGAASRVLVANGGRLAVYDRATHGTTTMALSRTPLGMLLTPTILLSGPVTVTSLQRGDGFEQISLAKTAAPDQGALRLLFRTTPLALDSVTVVDAYHRALTMRLSGVQRDPQMPPALFQPPGSPGS
jgi:outer membrane lipoprotein-sorting protein